MTTNIRDQLSELVHDDKMLPPGATLQSAGMQTPFRNIPNQVPIQTRISIPGPPTPNHWLISQQRMQSNPTKFDMSGQVHNHRFRERAVHNVPSMLQPQAVIYMQNGQALFGNSPNNMQVVGAPRLEHTHAHRNNAAPNGIASAVQQHQERPLKGVSGPSATMPFANANTHILVKSNTFNAVDGHATMPVPVRFVPVASSADTLGRDRQFGNNVGRNGNSRPAHPNWSNSNWTNQNSSSSQNWSNSVTPHWVATNQDRSAPNWTGQPIVAGVAGPNPNSQVNWVPYTQGQSHAHPNHGHGQRNTQKGSRGSRASTFAVAATMTTHASVPVANQPSVVADSSESAASHSSPPADATCSSSSPTGSTKIDSQTPSECGAHSTQPMKDDSAIDDPAEQLLPDTSLTAPEQLTSTSATSADCVNHVGQLIDTASPSTDVSSLPDSASATQTTELHSVSSASTSGIATPTRTSTSNKFGLTFGTEFSVEIDKIVNQNRPVPSVGVSISLSAMTNNNISAQKQRQLSLNNIAESQLSGTPISPSVPVATSGIDVRTEDSPLTSEAANASESVKTSNCTVPCDAQQQNQLTSQHDQPNHNEPCSSPYVVQLASELEKSFEDLQNKATRARKRVVRYAPQFTCFHEQQSDKSADASATELSGSSVSMPQVAALTGPSGTSTLSMS